MGREYGAGEPEVNVYFEYYWNMIYTSSYVT